MWLLFRIEMRRQNTSDEDTLGEWGLLSLEKAGGKRGSFWQSQRSSESHEWRCWGGRLLLITRKQLLWIDSLCPWVGWASYRVESAWSWMGLIWSETASGQVVCETTSLLGYINQGKESHILFHFPQFPPSDSHDYFSPKHRCRGGLMATSLHPAVSRVTAFHCRNDLGGTDRGKSKWKTLHESEVDNTLVAVVQSLSHVWLFATPWTVTHQAPLSMGFPRQEYWSGLPFPSPGDLPGPGIKPESSASAGSLFITEPLGKPHDDILFPINSDEQREFNWSPMWVADMQKREQMCFVIS